MRLAPVFAGCLSCCHMEHLGRRIQRSLDSLDQVVSWNERWDSSQGLGAEGHAEHLLRLS